MLETHADTMSSMHVSILNYLDQEIIIIRNFEFWHE